MAHSRVKYNGLGDNVGKAVGRAIAGFVLFLSAFGVLWWNEGRSVARAKILDDGKQAVSVEASSVDPSHDGALIHLNGTATTDEQLADATFGVSAQALKLERLVEVFQYKERVERETRKKAGGGSYTIETYHYDEVWSEDLIDSNDFDDPFYENPRAKLFESQTQNAAQVTVGAYTLSDALLAKISSWEELATPAEIPSLDVDTEVRPYKSGYFVGYGSPEQPTIGDVRISFRAVAPCDVSVIAQQAGSSFQPWFNADGEKLEELKAGILDKATMLAVLQQDNVVLTWLLRAAGFGMMLIGLFCLFAPLVALGDIIPFVGSLVSAGAFLFAGLISIALSGLTIASAWVFYRPLIGIPLALGSIAALVFVVRRGSQRKLARSPEPVAVA